MNSFKIPLLIVFVLMLGVGEIIASEEAEYTLMLQEGEFEVRNYAAHVLAETLVEGSFDKVGNKAFMRLFKYITDNNTSQQNIVMTSPVSQQKIKDSWAVSFTMPATATLETLPIPKDPLIKLRQVPARYLAVIRYSGLWTEKGYLENKAKLEGWIEQKGYVLVGEPVWARYNPPFKPWFLRRNEVLLPIQQL